MFAVIFFARTCLCGSLEKSQKLNSATLSCHTVGFAHPTYSIKTKMLSTICPGISEKRKN